jgi:hypothetical protein
MDPGNLLKSTYIRDKITDPGDIQSLEEILNSVSNSEGIDLAVKLDLQAVTENYLEKILEFPSRFDLNSLYFITIQRVLYLFNLSCPTITQNTLGLLKGDPSLFLVQNFEDPPYLTMIKEVSDNIELLHSQFTLLD